MSDKAKNCAISSTSSNRGRLTISKLAPASSRKTPASCVKDKSLFPRSKFNKNVTICEVDETGLGLESDNEAITESNLIDYGKFLRNMLEECLIDEKIKKEESQMEVQFLHLAHRFNRAMDILDKTSERWRQILFVVQQRRLLDLKKQDCARYYKSIEKSNAQELLENILSAGQNSLDTVEFHNVDFGYDKENGYRQLSIAVDEALQGLEQIKKHSGLNEDTFAEYRNLQHTVHTLEKYMLEFKNMDSVFKSRFPCVCYKVVREASDQIAMLIESDEESTDG